MEQSIHNIKVAGLKGGVIDFAEFTGKKVLLVNVASECGYTKQYQQLQELYEHFGQKLVVVGCPCDDFGHQEPGTSEEIAAFCEQRFAVTFPMTQKVNILGEKPDDLYAFLTKKSLNGFSDSTVTWNFQKYLLDENGHLTAYFPPASDPLSEEILAYFD